MIIVTGKTGQTANRLFLFAHLIAFAAENHLTVSNLAFDEYGSYFEGTCRDVFARFPAQASLLTPTDARRRSAYRIMAALVTRFLVLSVPMPFTSIFFLENAKSCELMSPEFRKLVKRRPHLVVIGWRFIDLALFNKHAEKIRHFFQPVSPHRENVETLTQSCRADVDMLIGVHIRRGDYKEFAGGRYFFAHRDYAGLMSRVQALFSGQRVRFLICSNEPVPAECFQEFDYRLGSSHPIEDMYALAACDYLLGPESTYTLWASFYGQVPLYRVYEVEKAFGHDAFVIAEGQFFTR